MVNPSYVPLDVLEIESMASGDLMLTLTEFVPWEGFPKYAVAVAGILGATIDDRADSAVERVWALSINGLRYWISFNDFALGVSLDSRDAQASTAIPQMRERLARWREEHR